MHWIAYALGAFYVLAGVLAIRAGRMETFTDAAIASITGDRTPVPEKLRGWFMLGGGALVLAGGVLLLALSRWAAPVFIAGTLLQAGYLLYASRKLPPEDEAQMRGRGRTINAMYVYATATGVVLWLESSGVIT